MNNIIKYLLILFCFNSEVFADENNINSIEVNGLERIEFDTVISYADIEINDLYDDDAVNNSLKNLFKTDLFSNIEINFNNGILVINVQENPTINLVKFEGNKKKKDADLKEEIFLNERSIYSRSKVKKDVEKLLTLYQRSGRLSTTVVPKVETLDNNRVNLIFEINESDIVTVSKITFIGNKVFSSGELRNEMKTKVSNFLRIFTSSDNYDPDKLEYDKELVSDFYSNNGYPNFRFTSSIAQLIPNRNSFEIILTVDEGDRYNFGNIIVNTELEKLSKDFVKNIIPVKENSIYQINLINKSVNIIKDNASVYGYSFIQTNIEKEFDNEKKLVNITFNINEGPKVYINRINIAGNTRTADRVIRRQLLMTEGDAYNKFSISRSKDKIRTLNFFSDVNLEEERTSDFDKLNININVEEKNTGEASIGAGYSSETKAAITFGITEQNFLGKGQQLKFQGNIGDETSTYDISFAEPYLYGKDLYIRGDLYSSLNDSSSVKYETETIGFGIELGFPLASDKRLNTKYQLYSDKTTADSDASNYEKTLSGSNLISLIGYTFASDHRNSSYKPSNGYNYSFTQELAGLGGTSNYINNEFQYNHYKRLNNSLIGAFKLKLGGIVGYNDKYAPISQYFQLGGKKLRGFKYGKIGPISGTSYTGGQYYYLLSTETNIDLPIENFDITSTLFIDIGSVWGLDKRYGTIDDKHNLRSSAGLNLVWDSALGPINFIFAQILKKESTDEIDKFYFDIGYNF